MSIARRERRVKHREERQEQVKRQRDAFHNRQRNKRIVNYTLLAIVIAAAAVLAYRALEPEGPGEHDALARCLSQNGVIMYGTEWCPHCQEQKQRFGASFRYVNYINCDLNQDACTLAGVEGYPTWAFPDGSTLSGAQSLDILAAKARCVDGS